MTEQSAFARVAQQGSAQAAQSTQDSLTGNNQGYDPLFGGERMPSLFTREHEAGSVRVGRITKAPYDRQSRFLDEDDNGNSKAGDLKFWGLDNKPTREAVGPNGKELRPVMDTIVPLQTEYAGEKGPDDEGVRGWFVAGAPALNALRDAIQKAGIRSREDMVGMTLTVERLPKIKRAWQYRATLSR